VLYCLSQIKKKEFILNSRSDDPTTPSGVTKPVTTTWEQHWTKLDDGSGRFVLFK
jgi:hypothetical protein